MRLETEDTVIRLLGDREAANVAPPDVVVDSVFVHIVARLEEGDPQSRRPARLEHPRRVPVDAEVVAAAGSDRVDGGVKEGVDGSSPSRFMRVCK